MSLTPDTAAPGAAAATADVAADFAAAAGLVRRRFRVIVLVLLAILAYLTYAFVALDVPGLVASARPERAVLLGVDSIAHKVHVEKDLRRGGIEIAVEGERTATYDDGETPPWATPLPGEDNLRIDLGAGTVVQIVGRGFTMTVPGYGTVGAEVDAQGTVSWTLPDGAAPPDWARLNERKVEYRPALFRRVQITRTRIEVHRYFYGWENFFFPFGHELRAHSTAALVGLAFSGERLDPERSNAGYMLHTFLTNPEWQHGHVFVALLETVLMAVLGTMTAVLVGLPLAFLAARNFTPSMALRGVVRRFMDFVRGVDALIWSLIFIRAFGLGPLTGALAIAVTDTGTLGKLFSEALENVDNRQIEGVRATGAGQVQRYRFGVIPQIMPVFISQGLYYLESNMRSATVIGALGAGGIGLVLVETLRTSRDWENTFYIIILTIALVVAIDQLSGWLRRRLIEGT
ncbi:MAG: phosphonate ABC transporter, permease protein PhnE [Pseudomonadota bacterium]